MNEYFQKLADLLAIDVRVLNSLIESRALSFRAELAVKTASEALATAKQFLLIASLEEERTR